MLPPLEADRQRREGAGELSPPLLAQAGCRASSCGGSLGVPSPAPCGAPGPLWDTGAAGWPSTAGEQGRGSSAGVSDAAVGSRATAGQRELVTAAGGFRLLGCLGEPDTKRKLLPHQGDPCLRREYLPWAGRRGQGGPGLGSPGQSRGAGLGGGAPQLCPLAARRHPNPLREGAKGWGEQPLPATATAQGAGGRASRGAEGVNRCASSPQKNAISCCQIPLTPEVARSAEQPLAGQPHVCRSAPPTEDAQREGTVHG